MRWFFVSFVNLQNFLSGKVGPEVMPKKAFYCHSSHYKAQRKIHWMGLILAVAIAFWALRVRYISHSNQELLGQRFYEK